MEKVENPVESIEVTPGDNAEVALREIETKEQYLEHFGLWEPPFQVSGTNRRFVYLTQLNRQVIENCLQLIRDRMGLGMVLGAVGSGKSSIANILYDRLAAFPEKYAVGYLDDLEGTNSQVMTNLLLEFGLSPASRQVEPLKGQFKKLLIEETQNNHRTVVLLIDEAQTASKRAMELIRLLLNFEADGDKLIQVILFGQPELARMVAARENLASRVVNTNWLKPLSTEETRAMIQFRLNVAGARPDIYSEEALDRLVELSKGIPREVCKIGYNTLLIGTARNEQIISVQTVEAAASSFKLEA
ncbi:MAG TPA: AAA family ATPase [Chloroflexia bacterium]|nr:AAA family ATPase [Chloroflexia bacterium]